MRRYQSTFDGMVSDPEGRWVRWVDIQDELSALRDQVASLEARLAASEEAYVCNTAIMRARTEEMNKAHARLAVLEAPPLVAVLAEVRRASEKFPTWPTDPLHAVAVLGEEFGELTKAVLQAVYEFRPGALVEVRKEAIQTGAMALRFIASLERYEYQKSEPHRLTASDAKEVPS